MPAPAATDAAPRFAVIVPVLDEAASIAAALAALQPMRSRGARIIVVDGGSADGTVALAQSAHAEVVAGPRGRARQMNAGAAHAAGTGVPPDVLLFLHADTRLPSDADRLIAAALARGARWGRFDVRIAGRSRWLPIVALLMNLRSRLTGICTGDQAIFTTRELFDSLGHFPAQPLMEDIEFSRRARRLAWPAALRPPAVTSGRRWDNAGAWRTIVQMWRLRWRYIRGVDATSLAREYRDEREPRR